MVIRKYLYSLVILGLLCPMSSQAYDLIRYRVTEKMVEEKHSYYLDLLKLALDETRDKYGDYQLIPIEIDMTQERTTLMLEKQQLVDIIWRMTSKELENRLQAIYFPLQRGLMGARIFIINKDQQALFTTATTLADLKSLNVGQGIGWTDSKILEHNGFNVTKANSPQLLSMLKKNRFDYFPRAIHEPWLEIKNHPDLSIEKNLLLYYLSPNFFFVNKQNRHLHNRLTEGLFALLKTGKFENFFQQHIVSKNILEKSNIKNRKVFHLRNPYLSVKTRQIQKNKNLWIKLDSVKKTFN